MSLKITFPNFGAISELLNQESQIQFDRSQSQKNSKDLLPAPKYEVDNFLKITNEKFIGRMGENGLREDKDRDAVIHHVLSKYQEIRKGGSITQGELKELTELVTQLGDLADIVEGKIKISNDEIAQALEKTRLGISPNDELYASIGETALPNIKSVINSVSKEYLLAELINKKGIQEKIEKTLNENKEFDFSKFWKKLDPSGLDLFGTAFAPPFNTSKNVIDVSRGFGIHKHPVHGGMRHHNGIDFGSNAGLKYGSSILASRSGKVVHAGPSGGYGNTVVIDHGMIEGKRYFTLYAHLSKISVKVGQELSDQQKLGEMGNSGTSTSAHLHFEIRRGSENQKYSNANGVNPTPFLKMGGLKIV